MTYSCWQQPLPSDSKTQTDVAIIGAGITGLSLAWWLKRYRPQTKITILERVGVAAGASGRNAGFNTAGSAAYLAQLVQDTGSQKATRYWQFKRRCLRLMQEELLSKFPAAVNPERGSITLYRDAGLWDEHRALLAQVPDHGFKPLSGADLPWKSLVGGQIFESDRNLHPVQLLESLAHELKSNGVVIINSDVGWMEGAQDGIKIMGSRGEVEAGQVFLALNGHASQLFPELKVDPKRAQMVALKVGGVFPAGNFYDPAHKVYFRFDPRGEALLVGGMRLVDELQENTVNDQTTLKIQSALEAYGQNLTQVSAVLGRWSGVMGFTDSGKPCIQDLKAMPRATFVGGYNGHGMGLAFGVAHEAVLRFLGRPSMDLDILC